MIIQKVLVIGAGIMGAGIAQLCAREGFNTVLTGRNRNGPDRAMLGIERDLAARVEKGKLSQEDKAMILSRIRPAEGYGNAADADVIIESVVEDPAVKKKVFSEIGRLAKPEALLVTNTTSLSISELASVTHRPERVVQMHFFNPPAIMKLVEIMPGKKTAPETIAEAEAFAIALGKDPVICREEAPAGIVSRILGQLLNEATWLVDQGIADPEDVDKAMRLGANHPMGPLQLLDLIGLDTHRAKMQALRQALNDSRYDHPPIVDRMIEQGHTGKKSGRGFYSYWREDQP